jgi:hypothetical protein
MQNSNHREHLSKMLALVGIAVFILSAVVGPWLSHSEYSSVQHSLSELAGQGMPNAWIMRTGFASFGGAVLVVSLMRLKNSLAVFGSLATFGTSMIVAAIFSHLPIVPILGGSIPEDEVHSLAATCMGTAFVASCGARLWQQRRLGLDRLSLLGLIVSILIPIIMIQVKEVAGLVQRLMFLVSFVWIVVLLEKDSVRNI